MRSDGSPRKAVDAEGFVDVVDYVNGVNVVRVVNVVEL